MRDVLDFSINKDDVLPVRFSNGLYLEIEKPTLSTVIEMQSLAGSDKIAEAEKAVLVVINNNKQGTKLTAEEFGDMVTIDDLNVLINAILEFCAPPKN